ncbi:unnamed protein product [Adineta steineri]|uniref:Uncharacterized protein n=1 Tax=Adineta steineri TaxID=433720 RepID=A0A813S994_9BILA|nr:unnamed protein product [Adineta steineri]
MGGTSSTSKTPAASLTTPSVAPATPVTSVASVNTTIASTSTPITKTTTTVTSPSATSTTNDTNTTPTTTVVTSTTLTPPAVTTVPSTITTVPSTTSVTTTDTIKPTFYSIAQSLITDANADVDKPKPIVKSAAARWYNWTKDEQQTREKGKILWYMKPPVTTTDISTTMTTTLTTTTANINNDQKETPDETNVIAMPSFHLRSTAIYSPPHGDRVLSGRRELTNTDISNYKYYRPDDRSNQSAGIHTRATMYRMNTLIKETPLPIQSTVLATTSPIDSTIVTQTTSSSSSSPLRTFVSRGLQTDLVAQPIDPSSSQMRYYEKQQSQIVPVTAFSNNNSNQNAFYYLTSNDTKTEPVLPPIGKTPVWYGDQPVQSYPTSASLPLSPTSILKKSSTVLSQDVSNPLSEQTHHKVLEQLRKHNKNTKDGIYRVKKIHLVEKNEQPSTVTNNLPTTTTTTKASQSILRSKKLFF